MGRSSHPLQLVVERPFRENGAERSYTFLLSLKTLSVIGTVNLILFTALVKAGFRNLKCLYRSKWGDGVAQVVERWTRDPKTLGSNPVMITRKMYEGFSESKIVLTLCRCAQPPCVYSRIRMITYAR